MSTVSSIKNSGNISLSEVPFKILLEINNFLENISYTKEIKSLPVSLCSGNVRLHLRAIPTQYSTAYRGNQSNEEKGNLTIHLDGSATQDFLFIDTKLDINKCSDCNILLFSGTLDSKRCLLKKVPENQTLFKFSVLYEFPSSDKAYSTFPENHPARKFSTTLSGTVVFGFVNETNNGTLMKSAINENILELFEAPSYSDIEISVADKNFSVHKCILTSRSPGFARIIKEPEAKSNNTVNIITINDFSPDVVNEGLRFIYSGYISPHISEIVCDLIVFADKYEIEDLKNVCENEIKNVINVGNVCRFVDLALKCKAKYLQEFCNDFITGNLKAVMISEGWKELKSSNSPAAFSILEFIALKDK